MTGLRISGNRRPQSVAIPGRRTKRGKNGIAINSASLVMAYTAVTGACTMPSQAIAADLAVIPASKSCDALTGTVTQAGDAPVRITAASVTTSTTEPSYCKVLGYVAPQVKFELRLPMNSWAQRLMFTGCGGFCGTINFWVNAAADNKEIASGQFALVSSNLGHDSVIDSDAVWARGSPQGRLDWGQRGAHVVTLAAKAIIADFYGSPVRFSYFNGCSDGGREALMSAQTFPDDFDGVLAGAPVVNVTANNSIYHAWVVQHLQTPSRALRLSQAAVDLLHEAVVGRCGAKAGEFIGLIEDPSACAFDPQSLQCRPGDTAGCLTQEEVGLVAALYSGPTNRQGKALYFGVPMGSELNWIAQTSGAREWASNFITYLSGNPSGAPAVIDSVGFEQADLNRYYAHNDVLNAMNANLAPFHRSGGKLIMWHGWSDSGVPPGGSLAYYSAVKKRLGGHAADDFMRLYMLPGVNHCGGGLGPSRINLLQELQRWVEDGVQPDAVKVSGAGRTAHVRPTKLR